VVMALAASSAVAYCMYAYLARISTKSIVLPKNFASVQHAKGSEKVN
jgi:hypothetical protein